MRNENLLKGRVSEIRVKRICVNQGVGVKHLSNFPNEILKNRSLCNHARLMHVDWYSRGVYLINARGYKKTCF